LICIALSKRFEVRIRTIRAMLPPDCQWPISMEVTYGRVAN